MDNASRVSCRDSSQRFIASSPSAVDRRFAGLLSSILSYLVQAFLYRCSVYQSHKRCEALSLTLFDETIQTWRRVVPTLARNPNTLFPGPNPTPTLETRFDACDYYVDTRIAHHSRTRTLNTQLLSIPVMSPQRTTGRGRRSKPPPVAPVVHNYIYRIPSWINHTNAILYISRCRLAYTSLGLWQCMGTASSSVRRRSLQTWYEVTPGKRVAIREVLHVQYRARVRKDLDLQVR
jgi:hypothetical protein